jgi:hypothetical protein
MVWPVRVELTVSTSQTWRPAPRLRPDDWRSKGQRPHGLRGSWRMVFDEHQTSPQQESNPQPRLRGPVSCPLDDEGLRLLRRTVKHPRRFVTVQGQVRSRRSRRGSRTLTGQALDLLPLPDWARRPWSPSPESNRATPSLRGKVTRRSERRGTAGETRTPNSPGLGRRPLPIGLLRHAYWPRDSNPHWRASETRASAEIGLGQHARNWSFGLRPLHRQTRRGAGSIRRVVVRPERGDGENRTRSTHRAKVVRHHVCRPREMRAGPDGEHPRQARRQHTAHVEPGGVEPPSPCMPCTVTRRSASAPRWWQARGVEPRCLRLMGSEWKPFHSPACREGWSRTTSGRRMGPARLRGHRAVGVTDRNRTG